MSHKIILNKPFGGSVETIFEPIPEVRYLERKVRFSFKNCDTDDWSVRGLTRKELDCFFKRLGYYEQIMWKDIRQLRRENGFSVEKRGDSNFDFLNKKYPNYSTYLHFRVNGTNTIFRVFGAINEDLCYLLIVDSKGGLNH